MIKLLISILCLTLLLSCRTSVTVFQTTDTDKIAVKSNKFKGTIFKSTYQNDKLFIRSIDSATKFTPTKENIVLAESILKEQIQKANKSRINQSGKHQYIDRNLNKYFRQYVGFVNEQGDSIVHINFYWNKFTILDRVKGYWDDRLEYTSDFSVPLDGGSRYWNINVNLTGKHLYGLSVNGLA